MRKSTYTENSLFEVFCFEKAGMIKSILLDLVTSWLKEIVSTHKKITLNISTIDVDDRRHQLARGKVGYLAKWERAYGTVNLEIIAISVICGSKQWTGAEAIPVQREKVNELYLQWKNGIDIQAQQHKKTVEAVNYETRRNNEEKRKKIERFKFAEKDWENAHSTDPANPYLNRKGIKEFGNWSCPDIRYYEGYYQNKYGRVMLARIRDIETNQTLGYQKIFPEKIARFDGDIQDKEFITDDTISGGLVVIKNPQEKSFDYLPDEEISPVKFIIMVEGIATGISIYLSLGFLDVGLQREIMIVCCLSCHNIAKSAQKLRNLYGKKIPILICGDDDSHLAKKPPYKNVGKIHAEQTATKYTCGVAFPLFEIFGIDRANLDYETAKGYTDFNDLYIRFGKSAVANSLIRPIEKLLKEEENSDITNLQEFSEEIQSGFTFETLKQSVVHSSTAKKALIFTANTGTGKTFNIAQIACECSQPCTIFASTVPEANRIASIIKKILINCNKNPEKEMSLVTADSYLNDNESNDKGRLSLKLANRILISTYGYLGRNGDSIKSYKRAKTLLQDRIVFFDEIQELYKKMFNPFQFSACYRIIKGKGGNGTYKIASRCPKSARKGGCADCKWAYAHEASNDRTKSLEFYHSFLESSLEKHAEPYPLQQSFRWEDFSPIDSKNGYFRVYKTLFAKLARKEVTELSQENLLKLLRQSEESDGNEPIDEYLNHLVNCMDDPQIRIEVPILKKDGKAIYPEVISENMDEEEQSRKIQFPKQPCQVPVLYGMDVLPLVQIFYYAKKVIFTSATIPTDMASTLQKVAKKFEWELEKQVIKERAFTFDVTLLKLEKSISQGRIFKILVELNKKRKEKGFIVLGTKKEAKESFNQIRRAIPGDIGHFEGQNTQYVDAIGKRSDKYMLTYCRSAFSRGFDMPDCQIVIVDCQQFSPMLVLKEISPSMSQLAIQRIMQREISETLTQIVGRVLRSNEPRQTQTVEDKRKIVVLLHGLPSEMSGFRVNPSLTHKQTEYSNTFANPDKDDKEFIPAVLNAITNTLDGQAVKLDMPNQTTEKIKDSDAPQRMLSKNQREELRGEITNIQRAKRQAKRERKLIELTNRVRVLREGGLDWRTVYQKLNLRRCNDFVVKLKQVFDYG